MVTISKARMENWAAVHRFINELEETEFNAVNFQENFQVALADPNSILLMAKMSTKIVGYASCFSQVMLHHNGRIGEIQEIFVAKEERGKGIGKILVDEIELFAKEQHWLGIEVCANIKRADAHIFYSRLGFQQTHYKFTKEF